MKTAIIIHGMPSKREYFSPLGDSQSNSHWLPWIQKELILKDVLAQTPEMPEPYRPSYEKWRAVFEQFKINKDTMLVGHSCGAGFLVRWLSENKVRVGRVALVAPWLDPDGSYNMENNFFKFKIDKNLAKRTAGTRIFVSADDHHNVRRSAAWLGENLAGPKFNTEEFKNKGHFVFSSMKTEKFPELRKFLLGK